LLVRPGRRALLLATFGQAQNRSPSGPRGGFAGAP
jgi:hypothetical protein